MEKHKGANDKLHDSNLGKIKNINNLSYNKESNSFEFDTKGDEHRYDHPLPYNTSAPNGEDSLSIYDDANPFLEQESTLKEQMDEQYEEHGMRIVDSSDSLFVEPEDKILSKTAEDLRTDLDEEGYPKNNKAKR